MLIQFVSDLHLDDMKNTNCDPYYYVKPIGDILILAGDICSFYNIQRIRQFINVLSKHFQYIFYIPGNHEYYYYRHKSSVKYTMKQLFQNAISLEKEISNLYFLDRGSVKIKNICISGCTMWSQYKNKNLPRYVRIHHLTKKDYNKLHTDDIRYLHKMSTYCETHNLKHIIVSHHSPIPKEFKSNKEKYTSLYYSNLDLMYFKNVSHWIFGHTHVNVDVKK